MSNTGLKHSPPLASLHFVMSESERCAQFADFLSVKFKEDFSVFAGMSLEGLSKINKKTQERKQGQPRGVKKRAAFDFVHSADILSLGPSQFSLKIPSHLVLAPKVVGLIHQTGQLHVQEFSVVLQHIVERGTHTVHL